MSERDPADILAEEMGRMAIWFFGWMAWIGFTVLLFAFIVWTFFSDMPWFLAGFVRVFFFVVWAFLSVMAWICEGD